MNTHIYVLPPAYIAAVESAGGGPSGFPMPEWLTEAASSSMDKMGTSLEILPISTPGVLEVAPKFMANGLPQPIVISPLATTRAAIDLDIIGTFRNCPDVDIVLSYAGGTLPHIGMRTLLIRQQIDLRYQAIGLRRASPPTAHILTS
ncbi:hypothetical protein BJ170DRAFT_196475 [Xylariales sp. AK1849]|nr:hypothetical protein BJ170DRAFT_196475 [Xylariales sp. AK1849]